MYFIKLITFNNKQNKMTGFLNKITTLISILSICQFTRCLYFDFKDNDETCFYEAYYPGNVKYLS